MNFKHCITFVIMAFASNAFSQQFEYEIKTNWKFQQEGKNEWNNATVPGVVHLDLLENEIIEDPYWENNELKLRWIENENWIYQTTFIVDDSVLKFNQQELIFNGLDTYATVYLNGKEILQAENMFREWKVDAKQFIKQGDNELKVVFQSPIKYNKKKVKKYPYQLPSGNESADIKPKVASFTRKAAYHFGWDWGPRFVTCGIWKPVVFRVWKEAIIENINVYTDSITQKGAHLRAQFDAYVEESGSYDFRIGEHKTSLLLAKGFNEVGTEFIVEDPTLWWCNGHGDPYLYNEEVVIWKDSELLDRKDITYGIRTIELVNEPDSTGTSFFFKLNGEPIFVQGANYIPQDMFLPRVSNERYEKLIDQVASANMNMIRVWGGGIYEKDIFYNLCDENGILVWQDFMFAGSLYPDDNSFFRNIEEEGIQNVKRLSGHPCLALWCGNNEIEVAWKNWGWQKQYKYSEEDSIIIWANYKNFFHYVLPEIVDAYTNLDYTPTSPLSNWGTPENFNHSSMHYWGVWHGREPFENFEKNVGRFMVEYGFQSFPDLRTLKKVISNNNLNLESLVMKNRQKSYIGNNQILEQINNHFSEPTSFENFIELSQKTQAKAMKIAIQAHMKKAPHCMGTMFWQLNDCWPGPSWSVIDYYGNEKQAYDVVKIEYCIRP